MSNNTKPACSPTLQACQLLLSEPGVRACYQITQREIKFEQSQFVPLEILIYLQTLTSEHLKERFKLHLCRRPQIPLNQKTLIQVMVDLVFVGAPS